VAIDSSEFCQERRLDAILETLISTLLLVVPCAILTATGVLLCKRWRLFAAYATHATLSEMTAAPSPQQDMTTTPPITP
jgi:hypothetical protein